MEFQYYSKNKFDYGTKREDILQEAIDLSSKTGEWGKYCELCIEAGQWEKAIIAAPNVSLDYWRNCTKRWAEYCDAKNTNDKLISSLVSNEKNIAIKYFMELEEYEEVKLIWITRNQNTVSDNKSGVSEKMLQLKISDKELMHLSEDDILFRTTFAIAQSQIYKGQPLLAASYFLSIRDISNCFKTLIRTNEIEIAYPLMKIFNFYLYEYEILSALMLREFQRNREDISFLIINQTKNIDTKIFLLFLYARYRNSLSNSNFLSQVKINK